MTTFRCTRSKYAVIFFSQLSVSQWQMQKKNIWIYVGLCMYPIWLYYWQIARLFISDHCLISNMSEITCPSRRPPYSRVSVFCSKSWSYYNVWNENNPIVQPVEKQNDSANFHISLRLRLQINKILCLIIFLFCFFSYHVKFELRTFVSNGKNCQQFQQKQIV